MDVLDIPTSSCCLNLIITPPNWVRTFRFIRRGSGEWKLNHFSLAITHSPIIWRCDCQGPQPDANKSANDWKRWRFPWLVLLWLFPQHNKYPASLTSVNCFLIPNDNFNIGIYYFPFKFMAERDRTTPEGVKLSAGLATVSIDAAAVDPLLS